MDKLLNLIGLAKKAGKLEVGSGVYGITQESLTQDFSLIGVDWKQEG